MDESCPKAGRPSCKPRESAGLRLLWSLIFAARVLDRVGFPIGNVTSWSVPAIRGHLPKLLINRAAENNSMVHVIDEHLLDLAANRVPHVEPGN